MVQTVQAPSASRFKFEKSRLTRAGLIAALTVVALVAWRSGVPGWAMALFWLLCLTGGWWVVQRRAGFRLLGPLFIYDLARLARRGRTTLLRATYATLLLAWLCVMLADEFSGFGLLAVVRHSTTVSLSDWAEFARRYAIALLSLQTGAVLLLTPPYLAGALTEEKERRTLEMLLASPLSDREIILGKLFGRLCHLGIVLLAALPIFALTRLWGGVDDDLLIGGLTVSVMTLLSVGALSIFCSVLFRTVLGAVICGYVLVFVLNIMCLAIPMTSPVLFVPAWNREVDEEWQEWQKQYESLQGMPGVAVWFPPPNPRRMLLQRLIPFVAVHSLLFLFFSIAAIMLLRTASLAPGENIVRGALPKDKVVIAWEPVPLVGAEARWRVPINVYSPTPVTEPALLWKEMTHGMPTTPGPSLREWLLPIWGQLVLVLVLLAGGSIVWHWRSGVTWGLFTTAGNAALRVATVVLAGLWCLQTAFRSAGSVSRERDQQTLDSLLALPGDREEILRAKWIGSIFRYRPLGYTLLVVWMLAAVVGALHPLAVLFLAAACGAPLVFLASVGVWLSVISRNTLWANMRMAFVFMCLFIGSWLGGAIDEPVARVAHAGWLKGLLEFRLAPVHAWWFLAFSWSDVPAQPAAWGPLLRQAFVHGLASLPLFAAVACLCWRLALRRFRDERSWRRK